MVVEGGIVSHYCISFVLVNCNFTDFMSLLSIKLINLIDSSARIGVG